MDTNGWKEYKKLILFRFSETDSKIDEIKDQIKDHATFTRLEFDKVKTTINKIDQRSKETQTRVYMIVGGIATLITIVVNVVTSLL